jgi:hypothetical protein
MSFVVLILLAAIGTGLLLGGSLRRFERVRLHWWGAALLGLAAQGITLPEAGRFAGGVVAASYACLLGFVAVNRRLPATLLMGAGLALNLAVTLPNGGMPVSQDAIRIAGGHDITIADRRHQIAASGDVLAPLGDTIPLPKPIGVVVSPGDLLLYAGIAWFVVAVMCGRFGENYRAPSRWFQMYRGKHEAARGVRRQALRELGVAGAKWGTER